MTINDKLLDLKLNIYLRILYFLYSHSKHIRESHKNSDDWIDKLMEVSYKNRDTFKIIWVKVHQMEKF